MTLRELIKLQIIRSLADFYVDCKDYGYGPYLDDKHYVGKVMTPSCDQPITIEDVVKLETTQKINLLDKTVTLIKGVSAHSGKVAITLE